MVVASAMSHILAFNKLYKYLFCNYRNLSHLQELVTFTGTCHITWLLWNYFKSCWNMVKRWTKLCRLTNLRNICLLCMLCIILLCIMLLKYGGQFQSCDIANSWHEVIWYGFGFTITWLHIIWLLWNKTQYASLWLCHRYDIVLEYCY